MKIGILGTGRVGQALAGGWGGSGHDVVLGSREPGSKDGLPARAVPLPEAIGGNDVVVNATPGAQSLGLIEGLDPAAFSGKVLIDVANATTPEFGLAYPNSSLAEKLQEALPDAHVVKSMNTAAIAIMVEPAQLPDSSVFLSGDDAEAKDLTRTLLGDLGWQQDAILDLGGVHSARGPEHYFLMFAALLQALDGPQFNIRVVRGTGGGA